MKKRSKMFRFKKDHVDFLLANYQTKHNIDLAMLFNERFGTSLNERSIINFKNNRGLRSENLNGVNRKTVPIGTIRIKGRDVLVKTENKWQPLSRMTWEKHHGKIPKGKVIMFLDGNSHNCNIENLYMVPRAVVVNTCKERGRSNIPEITKANVLLTQIQLTANERKRGGVR